eukprot:CAMPEP_0178448634 /NCGR_PEP_ID=MMETSP0689_2-20121128/42098_1 /TAXON_ID=160604 /ORGANISM="Amphidinium massartii, Strain CS-259" /LENGTH=251 /DNA_ID=CAMNT_0020073851 /DNA_START=61 /DNA_END=816 /DNA_ORIENTATION=+
MPSRQEAERHAGRTAIFLAVAALLSAASVSYGPTFAPPLAEHNTQQYVKALRGRNFLQIHAAQECHVFRHLASVHTAALSLRRMKNPDGASSLYESTLRLHEEGVLPRVPHVPPSVVTAHASLNLALTEQAKNEVQRARHAFQRGVALVQALIRADFHVWVDGRNRLQGEAQHWVEQMPAGLTWSIAWLATLLASWALMETKHGRSGVGVGLAARAACLDESKAPLLKWKQFSQGQKLQRLKGGDEPSSDP